MASSSSSSSRIPMQHQVFLSFRGEDTRLNFTAHLLEALKRKGLDVFFDEEKLERGEELSPALSLAIAASNLSIIVLSSDYASSKSCLAELSDIMHQKDNQGQIVLPIFYHVDPSDVRNIGGSFKASFDDHESKGIDLVQQWKKAFARVGKLKGWHIEGGKFDRPDTEYIKNVFEYVIRKLNSKSTSVSDELFGIDDQKNVILGLIEQQDSRVIGLWGMGGIGKTTLAQAVYDEISPKFQTGLFLQNVREEIKNKGMKSVRNELLSKLLDDKIEIDTPSIGSNLIKERLNNKRVIVVLDDVDDSDQIDCMGVKHFSEGSKIIVSSRDRQVLKNGGVDKIHEVKKLNENDSLQLFTTFSFKLLNPPADFRDLSFKFLRYAQGSPLALKVLGSKLYAKSRLEWESEVDKLKQYTEPKLSQILKSSFDGLDELEKNIFLDIACFFKCKHKEDVEEILSCSYKGAVCGLSNLVDKCLIDINHGCISMHDMLEEMGKEIVHQESKNPGKRSRLWSSKDVYHVLKNNKGTESIEGIKLDTSQIDYLQLCSSIFENMLNLRYMHFYGPSKKLHADGVDIVSLPDELRHLCWEYYPFKSLSPSFNPKNLAVLILEYGDMEQLWKKDNRQDLGNLREIYIYCCKKLKELPNLLGAINLKRLSCYGCESLVELPCLNHLASLELLELSKCKNLRKIPSLLGANNLKILDCKWCASLVELPCLNHLTSLETLLIYGCYSLKKFPELPNNFYKLDLSRTGIEEVSDSIEHLFRLEKLFLTSSEVKNVSSNISRLRSLSKLVIDDCISLKSLSELPRYLWSLRANNCSSLENVSFTDQNLYQFNSLYDVDDDGDGDDGDVAYLKFYNCFSLNQDSIKNIESNAMLQIQALSQIWSRERVLFRDGIRQRKSRFNKFFCCLPGNEILANGFEYQSMNSWLNLKIGLNRCSGGRFLAFAICFVVDLTHCNLFDLQFKCELLLKTGNCAKFKTLFLFCDGHSRVYKGNHVLILFYRNMIIRDNDYKEASFKFSFDNDFGKETEDEFTKVKKCGVHLFYVDAESYAVSAATEIGPGDNRSLSYRDENFGTQEDANIEEAHDHIGGEEGEGGSKRLKYFHFI